MSFCSLSLMFVFLSSPLSSLSPLSPFLFPFSSLSPLSHTSNLSKRLSKCFLRSSTLTLSLSIAFLSSTIRNFSSSILRWCARHDMSSYQRRSAPWRWDKEASGRKRREEEVRGERVDTGFTYFSLIMIIFFLSFSRFDLSPSIARRNSPGNTNKKRKVITGYYIL